MHAVAFGIILMSTVDAGLYVTARRLQKHTHDRARGFLPMGQMAALLLLFLLIHLLAGFAAKSIMPAGNIVSAWIMGLSILTGAPPGVVVALMLSDTCGGTFANSLFMPETDPSALPGIIKARRFMRDGDISGAHAAYRSVATEHPQNPDPLYALAMLQRSNGDTDQAIATYRDLLARFRDDTVIWKKASLLLADLYETVECDLTMAQSIRRNVEQRT